MDVYDQFIDPTVVSDSISCHFTSLTKKDLIVVKNTLLQVFQIDSKNDKLILNHEFKLNGKIIGIKSIKLPDSQYDQLAILTSLAKLSIVSFDHDLNTIQTNSLHYYESEFYTKSISKINESQLKIDPNNQTSLVVYNDLLAFLPFKQDDDEIIDDDHHTQSNDQQQQNIELFHNSIILPANKLESTVSNIIDCDFLHSYRDPTLAILHNKEQTWASDLSIKKDTVNFVVLSLDLLNDSSTAILLVENLPYDLWFVKPLPDPINGTLLIGCNEIIHIDNSGNTKGIGLNKYYQDITDFKLKDQSDLNIFLEHSKVEILNDKNILIIDQFGESYNLQFFIDGKSVKDLLITKFEKDLQIRSPISITNIDEQNIFIGCQSSDSILIKYEKLKQETNEAKPTTPAATKTNNDDDDEDLYEDEDLNNNNDDELINFNLQIKDKLFNAGPLSSFTLGKINPNSLIQGLTNPNQNDVSIVGTSGEGKQGKLTLFNQSIQPKIHSSLKFNNINKTWNILNKYLITTDLQNFKSEIFLINENFKNFQSFDFKNNNITINIDTIQSQKRILQITSNNVYLFDLNFKKLLQINFDFEIINGKIFDPFIIITSSKGEVKIFEMDPKGKKLNKVKIPKIISDIIITFGTISLSKLLSNDKRGSKRSLNDENPKIENSNILFMVTTVNNQILIFEKNHNEQVYQIDQINKLNEVSKIIPFESTKGLIPDPFIKEIEFSEIGDEFHSEEILTILTIGGELILYKIFKDLNNISNFQKIENLNLITGAPENLWIDSTILEKKLIKLNIKNQKFIFVTGKQPYIIWKTNHSIPKIFKFTSKTAISICKIKDSNDKDDDSKFMYIDIDKTARICSLPIGENFNYSQNLPIEIVSLGQTPNKVTYHETSGLFIVSTFEEISYNAIDEDGVPIVGSESEKPKAKNFKGFLKLINPINWTIIDEIEMEENEIINDVRSINLTISSRSKKKKEFIIFGIGKYRLEDLSVFGEFKIIDIISIVPDPTKPEAIYKFKEIFQEVVKGAVTTINEISGRFLTSQGQKIIIRDLQQDNSTVPVAFMDCATYLSDSKSFGNLLLISDSMKSIWFLGFDAEPYRLLLLGKDQQRFNAITTDFIVDDGEIYFLVADDEESLHLLTYQPDDPKSLSGQKLLQKSTFTTNSITTCLKLVPKFNEFDQGSITSYQNIGVNVDGSIFKMIPIDEISYRRLYILQQQLSDKIAHYVGLNPRSNRFSANEQGQKPIIEFGLLKWFINLNVDKRKQFSAKVGRNDYLELFKDFITIENTLKNLQ
ncbi:hypothetical protein BN7_5397 [Wickerhamomyces ciferrii]|uniref:Uncharacterized protein n=1 Tax=Wickerhamomyces ciferrii (strain ATCC 14091 / BCRC 22168 / CBS 111 / JCM 3599 / NBRC 0793 / NRRL Y-1031 F-60-10) TaxID=1206466 RepID=K0KRS5_WICCF|nr:uncharacterized protein BN7_5397 [Wickerhamomyces ciferrii]CCH45811.1 hypothetical protein BN7_5397 [Wickerhamomyces ciferrii]